MQILFSRRVETYGSLGFVFRFVRRVPAAAIVGFFGFGSIGILLARLVDPDPAVVRRVHVYRLCDALGDFRGRRDFRILLFVRLYAPGILVRPAMRGTLRNGISLGRIGRIGRT